MFPNEVVLITIYTFQTGNILYAFLSKKFKSKDIGGSLSDQNPEFEPSHLSDLCLSQVVLTSSRVALSQLRVQFILNTI